MSQSASEKFDSYWKKGKCKKVQTKGDKRMMWTFQFDLNEAMA